MSASKVLQGLSTASRYAVKVRAFSTLGVPSAWSDILEFTTIKDSSIPNPPGSLSIDFNSPDLFLNWTAPTTNQDGTQAIIDHYVVTLSITGKSVQYNVSNVNFSYIFSQNKVDFIVPQPILSVAVQAVTTSGNMSIPIRGTAINPIPPDPRNPPILVAGFSFISITMSPPAGMLDLDGFHLQSSDDGLVWNDLSDTFSGNDSYVDEISQGTTRFYRYKVRDVFNQYSNNYSPSQAATSLNLIDQGADNTPPGVPEGLTGVGKIDTTTQLPYIDVSWNSNTEDDMNYYEVRYRLSTSSISSSVFIGFGSTTHRLLALSRDVTYLISIRAVDLAGNKSGWASEISVSTGHSLVPPPVPSTINAISVANGVVISWSPDTTDFDFSRFELWASQTNGFSPPIAGTMIYTGPSPNFVHMGTPGDVWYYRIRAIDQFGNTSAFSTQGTGTIGVTTIADLGNGSTIGAANIVGNTIVGGTFDGATFNIENSVSSGIFFKGSGGINWLPGAFGGITVSNSGFIQSANYDPVHNVGWQLGPSGLEIFNGTIAGSALQIGVSNSNFLTNSSFENYTGSNGVADNWVKFPSTSNTSTYSVVSSGTSGLSLYGSFQQKLVASGGASVGISQTITFPGLILAGTSIAISYWVYETVGSNVARMRFTNNDTSSVVTSPVKALTLNAWTRITTTFTLADNCTSATVDLFIDAPIVGNTFYIDGAQFQFSSYITDYQPKALEIPNNYIQSAWISDLTADKITTGTINAATITMAASGVIQSFNFASNTGYQISSSLATFQNGAIAIVGAGGVVKLDSTSFRAIYSGVTQLSIDSTGVYIGGTSTANASVYFNPSTNKTIFQSTTVGFQIDTSATLSNRVLRLYPTGSPSDGTADTFYLQSDGLAYFKGGVIGLTGGGTYPGFHVDQYGNMWLGDTNFSTAPFRVDHDGNLTATSATISGNITGGTISIGASSAHSFYVDSTGNMWLGSSNFGSAPFSVSNTGGVFANHITLKTASGTNYLLIDSSNDNIQFHSGYIIGGSTEAPAYIQADTLGQLKIVGGAWSGMSAAPSISLGLDEAHGGGSWLQLLSGNSACELLFEDSFDSVILKADNSFGGGTISVGAAQSISITGGDMNINSGVTSNTAISKYITLSGQTSSGYLPLMTLRYASGSEIIANIPTAGAGLDSVVMSSTHQFLRFTSSIEFKENIEDLDIAGLGNPVFQLKPRRFTWKPEFCERSNTAYDYKDIGMISEEVAAINKGLVSWHGDRVGGWLVHPTITLLIDAVQYLKKRNDELEERMVRLDKVPKLKKEQ